jgi:actin-like protein 6A
MYFQKPEKFVSPYVLEIGSYTTRAGYAGCDLPTKIHRTETLSISTPDGEQFYSYNPIFLNSNVDLENARVVRPIQGNSIPDWDVMEEYLDYILSGSRIELSDTPLLLVEPPVHIRENRIKFVEMLFEKLDSCGVSFAKSSLMSAYLSSRENALVVDIGAYNTYVTPVHEGFIMNKAMMMYNFGGTHFSIKKTNSHLGEVLTDELRKVVLNKYPSVFDFSFVRNRNIYTNPTVRDFMERKICADIKHSCAKMSDVKLEDGWKYNEIVEKTTYELPDERTITVGKEGYEIPEIMVNPEKSEKFKIPTIQQMIMMIKEKIDVEPRKDIMSNIILCGGSANIFNFMERLQKELMNELYETHYTGKIKS